MTSSERVDPAALPRLARAGNLLVTGQADTVLDALATDPEGPVPVRLALLDPPYNRRTRFHHYADSVGRPAWVDERRRQLARVRELLTPDGSVWVHIDDAEMPAVRVLMDEVFGPANFLATTVWQKSLSRDNRTPISTTHEYVVAYAHDKTTWHRRRNKMPPTPEQLERYRNPDDDPRGPWSSGDLTAKAGPGRRAEQFYDLVTPGGRVVRPATGTCWRYTRERLAELIDDDRIYFGDGHRMPRLKRFLSEVDAGLVPDTWWAGDVVGTADSAKKHLKRMFPDLTPFETPKPEALVARIIGIASDPGDTVLDVYAGSGTTAAVAHKTGRHWVVVEREERTVAEFTRPRIELVVKGLDPGGVTLACDWRGGGDFSDVAVGG